MGQRPHRAICDAHSGRGAVCRSIPDRSSPTRTDQSNPETSRRSATTACAGRTRNTPTRTLTIAQYAMLCIKRLYDLRPYFRPDADLVQRAQKCAAWELPSLSDDVLTL